MIFLTRKLFTSLLPKTVPWQVDGAVLLHAQKLLLLSTIYAELFCLTLCLCAQFAAYHLSQSVDQILHIQGKTLKFPPVWQKMLQKEAISAYRILSDSYIVKALFLQLKPSVGLEFVKSGRINEALHYITNIIYGTLYTSKPVAKAFLGLAKSFDTVNQKVLLDKLYHYGIRGIAHNKPFVMKYVYRSHLSKYIYILAK